MSLHDSDRRSGVCQCPECKGMRAFEDVTGPQAGVATDRAEWDAAKAAVAKQVFSVDIDVLHNEAVAARTGKPYVAPRPFKTDAEVQALREQVNEATRLKNAETEMSRFCQCPECKGRRAFKTGVEVEATRQDARLFGVGYLVNGKRVDPLDVIMVTGDAPKSRQPKVDLEERFGSNAQVNRLPEDSEARKAIPLVTGLIDYFPNALAAVAALSKFGNDKHNPGEALHWTRGKSNDHADCIGRHLVDRGGHDKDGNRHSAMLVWRALALLEEEMEAALGLPISRGSV